MINKLDYDEAVCPFDELKRLDSNWMKIKGWDSWLPLIRYCNDDCYNKSMTFTIYLQDNAA